MISYRKQALKIAADTILLLRHIKHPIAFKQALREDDYECALKHTDLTEEQLHDRVGSIREQATDLAEDHPKLLTLTTTDDVNKRKPRPLDGEDINMSTNPNDNDEAGDTPSDRPRTNLDVLRDLFGDWFGLRPSPDENTTSEDGGDSVTAASEMPLFAESKVYQHQARLVELIDGDTLTVDVDLGFRTTSQWRVRLAGVDTGEIYGTEKQSAEYQRGKDHEAFVEGWLDDARTGYDGEWPLIVLSVEKGKYGRFISAIRRKSDDSILNDALIDEFGLEVVSDQ